MAMSTTTQNSTIRLQQILLSWDYWDLATRTENGEGAMATLKAVPCTFASTQVCHIHPFGYASSELLLQLLHLAILTGIHSCF